jgi:putative phosphoribosyl transferase
MIFRDREEAGGRLADRLSGIELYRPVVLALPRGGVPVAAQVAAALDAPLDVFVARKVGAPGHAEFGIGAIAEGSDEVVVSDAAARVGVSPERMEDLAAAEREELARRVRLYRGDAGLPDVRDHDVVLVDDGLATGVTARAALRSLERRQPRRLVLAVPVCAPETVRKLRQDADEVVCVLLPRRFAAVGLWYEDFRQTSDETVIELLERARTTVA